MVHLNNFKPLGAIMKFNRYTFVLACATIAHNPITNCHLDPFESIQKSMKIMDDQMQSMFDNINKMHQNLFESWKKESANPLGQDGINLTIDEAEANTVKVIISGIQAEQFDAAFGDKELTIKTQHATIALSASHSMLSASINQEIKQELSEKDEKNAKDKKTSHEIFSSSSQIRQMISKPVAMEDAKIDYNKETKTLTVSLPTKDQKKATKVIPVNVK